jgi:hypothetical protein
MLNLLTTKALAIERAGHETASASSGGGAESVIRYGAPMWRNARCALFRPTSSRASFGPRAPPGI